MVSALLASTGRGGAWIWSGTESLRAERAAGRRGAKVQQVVAERKEQSRSVAEAEEEEAGAAAAAQPESRAMATVANGIVEDELMVGQGETRPAPSR